MHLKGPRAHCNRESSFANDASKSDIIRMPRLYPSTPAGLHTVLIVKAYFQMIIKVHPEFMCIYVALLRRRVSDQELGGYVDSN